MDRAAPAARQRQPDEKYCEACGNLIKKETVFCPHCGIQHRGRVSKLTLMLFTFFFGGVGAHKFYIGKYWQGTLYILFCWTAIPPLIALVELIIYAATSEEQLQERYSAKSAGVVIAIVLSCITLLTLLAILTAILIPSFIAYQSRADRQLLLSELRILHVAEEKYHQQHNTYTTDLTALQLELNSPHISVRMHYADNDCFLAVGSHDRLPSDLTVTCRGIAPENNESP